MTSFVPTPLSAIRAVLLDMDGVLWRGDQGLPGLGQLFAWLHTQSIPYALVTNNSSQHPEQYLAKLAGLGIHNVALERIMTSGAAAARYLQTHYPAGTRVHVVGMSGLRRLITEAGFTVVDDDARVVVSGIDREWTYAKAMVAMRLLRAGAEFIGTNGDATFPVPDGLAPGAGSILAMLSTASGKTPILMGKPEPAMFEAALHVVGQPANATLMVGDRLDTDIAGARALGLVTALLLSGVSQREDAAHSPTPPDYIFDDLPALLAAIQGA
jgi:4-nitrophenyl phosphatase